MYTDVIVMTVGVQLGCYKEQCDERKERKKKKKSVKFQFSNILYLKYFSTIHPHKHIRNQLRQAIDKMVTVRSAKVSLVTQKTCEITCYWRVHENFVSLSKSQVGLLQRENRCASV
jgi:hypothetical protein